MSNCYCHPGKAGGTPITLVIRAPFGATFRMPRVCNFSKTAVLEIPNSPAIWEAERPSFRYISAIFELFDFSGFTE